MSNKKQKNQCVLYPVGKQIETLPLGAYLAGGKAVSEIKTIHSVEHITTYDGQTRVKPIFTDGTEGIFVPCGCNGDDIGP